MIFLQTAEKALPCVMQGKAFLVCPPAEAFQGNSRSTTSAFLRSASFACFSSQAGYLYGSYPFSIAVWIRQNITALPATGCLAQGGLRCRSPGICPCTYLVFISNDMGILIMQQAHSDYWMAGDCNKETFRLDDFPFVFHTPDCCRKLLGKAGIQIFHEVTSDSFSELMQYRINSLDEASDQQYQQYHFYICE